MARMKGLSIVLICLGVMLRGFGQENAVSELNGIESEISISVNPNDDDEIIIAAMQPNSPILIYQSTDGGMNWQQSLFTTGLADPVLTYGDNDQAYLSYLDFGNTLEMSIAESADNGESWEINQLSLDGKAADRQWIKRDNSPNSPYYGNIYIAYFHPEDGADIHLVVIDAEGIEGTNKAIHNTNYSFVQNPAITVGLDGSLVISFIAEDVNGDRKIVAVHSLDGGDSFSSETTIAPLYMYNASGDPVIDVLGFAPGASSRLGNSLQMAIDHSAGPNAGRVYLSWTDFVQNNAEEGMNIYLSYTDDNGQTWSSPSIVNDDGVASSHQYYAGIDVNPLGLVCLSWYDRRVDPTNDALTDFYFSYSSDSGQSFNPSIRVNTVSADHTAVTNGNITFGVGEYTSLATTATAAYVVWADGRDNDGGLDIYFAKISLDGVNDIFELNLSEGVEIEQISPNPVLGDELFVKINAGQSQLVDIAILDAQGQIVLEDQRWILAGNEQSMKVDLASNLSAGAYYLRIKHSKGINAKGFIIMDK